MKRIFSTVTILVVLSMLGCSSGISQGDSASSELAGGNFKEGDIVEDPNAFYFEYTFEEAVDKSTVTEDTFHVESYDADEEISQAEVLAGSISFPESDKARFTPETPPECGSFVVLTLKSDIKYASGGSFGDMMRLGLTVVDCANLFDGDKCSKPLWDGESDIDERDAENLAFTMQQMTDAFGPEGTIYPFMDEEDLICIARYTQSSLYESDSDDTCIDGIYYLRGFEACGINTGGGGDGGGGESCDDLTLVENCQDIVDRGECESSFTRVDDGLQHAPCYYNEGREDQAEVEENGCFSSWGPGDDHKLCNGTPYFGYSSDRDFVDADLDGNDSVSEGEVADYQNKIFGADQEKMTLRDYAEACTALRSPTGYFLRGYTQNWHDAQVPRDGACQAVYDINMGDSAPREFMQFRYDVDSEQIVFALPDWQDASWNMFGDPLGFGSGFVPADFATYSWGGLGSSVQEPSQFIMYSEDGTQMVAGQASIMRVKDDRVRNGYGGDIGTGGDFGYQYMVVISMYYEVDEEGNKIGDYCDSSGVKGDHMPLEFVWLINGDCTW